MKNPIKTIVNDIIPMIIITMILIIIAPSAMRAAQTDIAGPAASNFGTSVTVLPNGNIVVTAPSYDIPAGAADVGAVYLYDGATLAIISTLTGSTASDAVGNNGVVVLTNGNFVIRSQNWDNGTATNAGAVTFCSAVTGCNGAVSSANSLIGSTASDAVGSGGVTVLTNGNYVVNSPNWDNPSPVVANVGAVTWGNGATGTSGVVSGANSLIGSTASDAVGSGGVTVLTNGNYVVRSPSWDNPSPLVTDVGAATWGDGTGGTSGAVSSANSLVGSTINDGATGSLITALTNGNYVVRSPNWDNQSPFAVNAGSVTWGNGATGTSGVVSSANSLVGSADSDNVGDGGILLLTNGNYVVGSPSWSNGAVIDVGAATWSNGASGIIGTVSSANSLIGSTASDSISNAGITALTNGNYVVRSASWRNGAATNAGAATWGNGTTGISGVVSSANSLVGSTANDQVGSSGVSALTNGNYVVSSQNWDNGAATNAGAVTWGNGTTGTSGAVSATNSLVGSMANNSVGIGGVVALTNGNYVVRSYNWDNGAATDAGAVTWGNGASGISGVVSSSNSLVGSTAGDTLGISGVTALTNGNYVVVSLNWNNGGIVDAGAVTWGNGTSGISGAVSSANSLVGSTASDQVGINGAAALTNGNYVVRSQNWNNGVITDAGAVTWGNGASGTIGAVSSANSLVGSTASDQVGSSGGPVVPTNGNYVASSPFWDNGAINSAGAFTFGSGAGGTTGAITSGTGGGNSVVGTVASGVNTFAFDATRNRLFVGRTNSNTVSILSFTTTAIANGNLNNAANWDNGVPNGLVTGIIPSGRTMTISTKMNIGQLQVQCGGTLTGGSMSAYIVGSVRRDFCAATGESFTFPIGDPSNYSPFTASNTNGTGNLTAAVTDTFMPGLNATALSLSRYWSLDGAGITTNLTFQYVDADVNGTEGSYQLFRRPINNNALITQTASTVNTVANTITATNISQFSDWSASAQPLTPTAANVSIGGRVLTQNGAGLRNAIVNLTLANGETRTARTSSFGYYRFDDIEVGQTVIISVTSKQFQFTPQIINVADNAADVDFIAEGENLK